MQTVRYRLRPYFRPLRFLACAVLCCPYNLARVRLARMPSVVAPTWRSSLYSRLSGLQWALDSGIEGLGLVFLASIQGSFSAGLWPHFKAPRTGISAVKCEGSLIVPPGKVSQREE